MINYALENCAYCDGKGSMRIFQCNICGQKFVGQLELLERDIPSCSACGSTVRVRAVINVLSIELFGKNLTMLEFPTRPDITCVGLSDWEGYAIALPRKLNYINTYYHQEPKLDITNINPALEGALDVLISTDVFEHVAPPISLAFANAYKLLKPNGLLIFTVPCVIEGKTIEYYPDLYNYEIFRINNDYILKNITKDGKEQIFENLVFHGGPGVTLAMRTFSERSIMEELSSAGFNEIKIYKEPYIKYGIYWNRDLPLGAMPIVARKNVVTNSRLDKSIKLIRKIRYRYINPGNQVKRCPVCYGQGKIPVSQPVERCMCCKGTGKIQAGRCPACYGTGWANALNRYKK